MGLVRLKKAPGKVASLPWDALTLYPNHNRNADIRRNEMVFVEAGLLSKLCEGGQGRRYLVQELKP